jgi:hypothetical protein
MKNKYEAAISRYFATEKWIQVTYLKYLWLKINGYYVRKNKMQ